MEPRKNLTLEGLRGLACLNVVLAHYMFTFMPYAGHFLFPTGIVVQRFGIEHWLAKPYFSVFYNGSYPVSIFFVMSGWVLTAPFFRGDGEPLPAALKRYPRLVIPAAGAILFSWLLFNLGLIGNQRAAEVGFAGWVREQYVHGVALFPDLLLNMLWGAPVNGNTEWDSPLWTLRIELLSPLLLFALIALFGKCKPLLITVVFTAIAVNIFPQNSLASSVVLVPSVYILAAVFERWVDRPAIRLANSLARPRFAIKAPVALSPGVNPRPEPLEASELIAIEGEAPKSQENPHP